MLIFWLICIKLLKRLLEKFISNFHMLVRFKYFLKRIILLLINLCSYFKLGNLLLFSCKNFHFWLIKLVLFTIRLASWNLYVFLCFFQIIFFFILNITSRFDNCMILYCEILNHLVHYCSRTSKYQYFQ